MPPPGFRVIPGPNAESARIEAGGESRLVVEWETEAALELSRGNPRRAVEIYDLILYGFPHYAKAWYNKAIILHTSTREYAKALVAYDQAHRALPGNLDILHNKAKLLSEMRRTQEAEATYAQVLKADPGYVKSLEGYAALLINTNRPAEAEPLLRRARAVYEKSKQDPYRALQLLATALTNMGKPKDAVKVLDAVLGRHPNDDSLWEAKGIALSNMDRYRDAVLCLTQALRLNRTNRFAWDTRQQLLEVCRQHKISFAPPELAF
jgi:tetratricopeptide (TPR) repeat protein